MKLSDVIMSIRSKLGDPQGETWSDNELIDCVNSAFWAIASKASPIKRIYANTLKEPSQYIDRPSDFCGVEILYVNGQEVTIKEVTTAFKDNENGTAYVSDDGIYVIGGIAAGSTVRLLYKVAPKHYSLTERFLLSEYWSLSVILYSIYLILMPKKASETDLQRTQQIRASYLDALSDAMAIHSDITNSRNITAPHQAF